MGDRKNASRRRAVGTREHIIAYLTDNSELYDPGGMASTRLATAVSYPGSSVAFAQLLSGMERSGLIERDVRGKRTYRIRLRRAVGAAPAAGEQPAAGADAAAGAGAAVSGATALGAGSAAGDFAAARAGGASGIRGLAGMLGPGAAPGFDYDELARRLLAQVIRRLAATEAGLTPDVAALRETVAGLEYELADAWAKHGKLAEENVRLREELRAAEQSLAIARESLRRLPVAADLDRSEVLLLQRLLAGDTAGWEAARSLRS
ncbi:MAG TPA: hypothetical protein VKU77_24010 [Streptosporangiaceae bacterium]|nr:hypothetical protein [Streptosporangiaceae bacterium]